MPTTFGDDMMLMVNPDAVVLVSHMLLHHFIYLPKSFFASDYYINLKLLI